MTTRLTLAGVPLWAPALGYRQQSGTRGLGLPVMSVTRGRLPGVDGSRVLGVRAEEREISIPMHIRLDAEWAFRAALRDIEAACATLGSVELTADDGDRRLSTDVYYLAGLEGDDTIEVRGHTYAAFLLRLVAPDPWWYAAEDEAVVITPPLPSTIYPPMLPLQGLVASSVLSAAEIHNVGTAAVWPVIDAQGPGSDVTLQIGSSTWAWSGALGSGEQLHVDMSPLKQEVSRVAAGGGRSSAWSQVELASRFVSIPPGVTPVSVGMLGASEGSSVRISWRPRYASAA